MDAVEEPIAETPVNIVKPAKTFFITSANAAELRKKAAVAKKANETALKQRLAELEAESTLTKPLVAQAIAQAAETTIEPAETYRLKRLTITREQLLQLDRDLLAAKSESAKKAIVDALYRLSEIERILDGRALPGSRRPGRESTSKRSGEVGPVE